jgi:hypothetical protein
VGEARASRRAHATLLAKHPSCIYCAGANPATTVEHMPPIMMFDQRQRPKGLEFPTCEGCNRGTRLSDLVASLFCRVYPDSKNDPHKKELKKLLKAVSNNVPGLLQEMVLDEAGHEQARLDNPNAPPGSGFLRANGPMLTKHMTTFGAKLGLAFHFEAHGTFVPQEGGVQPMYFTNVSALRGELPMQLINFLLPTMTLRQGRRHVLDQFSYSYQVTEERRHSVFYAVFRQSFAVAAVTALERSEFLMKNADKYPVIVPGDFRRGASRNGSRG